MDESMINLFSDRGSEIVTLLEEVSKFKAELRKKVLALQSLIDIQSQPVRIEPGLWSGEQELSNFLFHNVYLADNFVIRVSCRIAAEGWSIRAFNQEGNLESVRSLFNRLQIPFKEDSNLDGKTLLLHPTKYPYNEPLTTIQAITQDWINKIANSKTPQ